MGTTGPFANTVLTKALEWTNLHRHARLKPRRRVGVPQPVETDYWEPGPAGGRLEHPDKPLRVVARPSSLTNTRPVSAHAVLHARRSSSWQLRWARNDDTVPESRPIVRTDDFDFGVSLSTA